MRQQRKGSDEELRENADWEIERKRVKNRQIGDVRKSEDESER